MGVWGQCECEWECGDSGSVGAVGVWGQWECGSRGSGSVGAVGVWGQWECGDGGYLGLDLPSVHEWRRVDIFLHLVYMLCIVYRFTLGAK